MKTRVLQGALCVLMSVCILITSVVPVSASTELQTPAVVGDRLDSMDLTEESADENMDSEVFTEDVDLEVLPEDEDVDSQVLTETGVVEGSETAAAVDSRKVTPELKYSAHVQNIGWQSYVNAGTKAGTTGRHLQMEALKISLTGVEGLGIKYSAHVQNIGWQSFVGNNKAAGTTGKSLPMEAIKIELTGEKAAEYDVFYRVHVTNFGDLGWAKNGEAAGSQGYAYSMQAIEIKILPKKSADAPATGNAFKKNIKLTYSAHVQNIGWQSYVNAGSVAGTTGRNLQMEALKINLTGIEGLGIKYSAHVRNIGWQSFVGNNKLAGTTGKSLPMEAIKIQLTGEKAAEYDVFYRVHVTNFGNLGWAKNGEAAGSQGYAYSMQAIEIRILPKGSADAPATGNAFKKNVELTYSAHVQNIGWQSYVNSGSVAGTTGRALNLEAIKIAVKNAENLGIEYSAHVTNIGWMQYVSNGNVAGTTGRNYSLQALKIRLTGKDAGKYDIYYRAHVENLGWLDWAKNGEAAGSVGLNYGMQAVQIKLVAKGSAAPGVTAVPCCSNVQAEYSAYIRGQKWQGLKSNGSTAGAVGNVIDGLQVSVKGMNGLGIKYSAHVANVGWQDYAANGSTAGTPGKNQQIEAVKIKLSGSAAKYYNVWYRVYSHQFGWLGWAANGAKAGTEGYGYSVQAIQITVTPKGIGAPGTTTNPFRKYGDSQAMQYAKQILDQVGWNLKAAFDWSSSQVRYVDVALPPAGVSHAEYFGTYGFQNRQGNCYVMASTFYWMAKLLGYEVYLVEGEVPLRRGGMGPHGWCEVVIDGTTYVCDPDFTYDAGRNGYLITYGASGTWRYSNYQRVE